MHCVTGEEDIRLRTFQTQLVDLPGVRRRPMASSELSSLSSYRFYKVGPGICHERVHSAVAVSQT